MCTISQIENLLNNPAPLTSNERQFFIDQQSQIEPLLCQWVNAQITTTFSVGLAPALILLACYRTPLANQTLRQAITQPRFIELLPELGEFCAPICAAAYSDQPITALIECFNHHHHPAVKLAALDSLFILAQNEKWNRDTLLSVLSDLTEQLPKSPQNPFWSLLITRAVEIHPGPLKASLIQAINAGCHALVDDPIYVEEICQLDAETHYQLFLQQPSGLLDLKKCLDFWSGGPYPIANDLIFVESLKEEQPQHFEQTLTAATACFFESELNEPGGSLNFLNISEATAQAFIAEFRQLTTELPDLPTLLSKHQIEDTPLLRQLVEERLESSLQDELDFESLS